MFTRKKKKDKDKSKNRQDSTQGGGASSSSSTVTDTTLLLPQPTEVSLTVGVPAAAMSLSPGGTTGTNTRAIPMPSGLTVGVAFCGPSPAVSTSLLPGVGGAASVMSRSLTGAFFTVPSPMAVTTLPVYRPIAAGVITEYHIIACLKDLLQGRVTENTQIVEKVMTQCRANIVAMIAARGTGQNVTAMQAEILTVLRSGILLLYPDLIITSTLSDPGTLRSLFDVVDARALLELMTPDTGIVESCLENSKSILKCVKSQRLSSVSVVPVVIPNRVAELNAVMACQPIHAWRDLAFINAVCLGLAMGGRLAELKRFVQRYEIDVNQWVYGQGYNILHYLAKRLNKDTYDVAEWISSILGESLSSKKHDKQNTPIETALSAIDVHMRVIECNKSILYRQGEFARDPEYYSEQLGYADNFNALKLLVDRQRRVAIATDRSHSPGQRYMRLLLIMLQLGEVFLSQVQSAAAAFQPRAFGL